jgi:hypothetical protein
LRQKTLLACSLKDARPLLEARRAAPQAQRS